MTETTTTVVVPTTIDPITPDAVVVSSTTDNHASSKIGEKVDQAAPSNVTQVKPAWYWVKDAQGFGSVTVTLVAVAFWVTTLAYTLSIFQKIGPLEIRPFDVAAAGTYLIPILSLYFGRKYTDAKFDKAPG